MANVKPYLYSYEITVRCVIQSKINTHKLHYCKLSTEHNMLTE